MWSRVESQNHNKSWTRPGHKTGFILWSHYPSIYLKMFQIEDGEDFRVLISPLPPKVVEEVKEEKKVVKKKNDNRSNQKDIILHISTIFSPGICTAGARSTLASADCITSLHRVSPISRQSLNCRV